MDSAYYVYRCPLDRIKNKKQIVPSRVAEDKYLPGGEKHEFK